MEHEDFDPVERNLFRDMPSALKDSKEVADEKRMRGIKGFLAIFTLAAAGLAAVVYNHDADATPESLTETTLSNE